MRITKIDRVTLEGEDANTYLHLYYDNRGYPYREGLQLEVEQDETNVVVLLDVNELKILQKQVEKAISFLENKR
jgi:hypothetical protein